MMANMSRMPDYSHFSNRSVIHSTMTAAPLGDLAEFVNVPAPLYRMCFEARDLKDSASRNVLLEPYQFRCFKILIQLAPRYVAACPSFIPKPIVMRSTTPTTCALQALQPYTKVAVGQKLKAWIYFEDLNRDGTDTCAFCDTIEMAVLSDPGLPNGATLHTVEGGPAFSGRPADHSNLENVYFGDSVAESGASTQYLFSRLLEFTPTLDQGGLVYQICMQATEVHHDAKAAKITRRLSTKTCFKLEVMLPDVRIRPTQLDGPFGNAAAVLPETAEAMDVRVGCNYKWTLKMYEALDFDVDLQSNPSKAPVATFERGSYSFTASADLVYKLPQDAEISETRRIAVCDATLSTDTCTENQKYLGGYFVTEVDFSWTPRRGTESRTETTCLNLHEVMYPNLRRTKRCAKFVVLKCTVCVNHGDTLQSLARAYKTDWLQLWGANVHVSNPNRLVPNPGDQEVITLGPTHVIDSVVKLSLLAKRFRMTPAKVLDLNPDLASNMTLTDDMVAVDTHVCLMPDICSQEGDVPFA